MPSVKIDSLVTKANALETAQGMKPHFGDMMTSQRETVSDGTVMGLNDVTFKNEPDLTYYCDICNIFVNLVILRDHKGYHEALRVMGCDSQHVPKTSEHLLSLRNTVIGKLKEESIASCTPFDIEEVKRIDDAYEFLKQDIEDTFESCRKVNDTNDVQVQGSDLNCSIDFVLSIAHCSSMNKRWKFCMEDAKVYQDYFGNNPNRAFLALYDGYNGKYASSVAANELHYLLLNQIIKFDQTVKCRCTFNMMELNDISNFDLIRPPTPAVGNVCLLHNQGSLNLIQQVIYTCEEPESTRQHLSSHHPCHKQLVTDEHGVVTEPLMTQEGFGPTPGLMKDAMIESYRLTDDILSYGGDEASRVRWSGCSALTIVIDGESEKVQLESAAAEQPFALKSSPLVSPNAEIQNDSVSQIEPPKVIGRLHIANAGNIHAVLVRDNRSYLLTKDHTYNNLKERHRIERQGGGFSRSDRQMRVLGVSATTRGLGNHGDPKLKQLVTWKPHCTTVKVDQYCQFLIMATHGIWEVFSPQEAAELLLQILPQNQMSVSGYLSPSIEMLNKQDEALRGKSVADTKRSLTSYKEPGISQQKEMIDLTSSKQILLPVSAALGPNGCPAGGEEPADKENATPNCMYVASVRESMEGEAEGIVNNAEQSEDSGNEADVESNRSSTVIDRGTHSAQTSRERYFSRLMAERLVQSALVAGAKDNISAIIILLPGTKLN